MGSGVYWACNYRLSFALWMQINKFKNFITISNIKYIYISDIIILIFLISEI